jgi:multiple sugar transport system substrate-binding protein
MRGRVFVCGLCLLLIVPMALFAAGTGEKGAKEQVTIKTLTFEGVEKTNLDLAAKAFSEANPGVDVVIEYTSYPTTREKLVTELTAGTGRYDFLFILDDWMPEFMRNGWLEPLDSYIKKDPPTKWPEDWPKWGTEVQTGKDGKLYAFPNHGGPLGFMYRKDLLSDPNEQAAFKKQFGYDLPDPSEWRWEKEFKDAATFFTRPDKNFYGLAWGAKQGEQQLAYEFIILLWGFGGEVFDQSWHPTFNSPSGEAALRYYVDSINKYKFAMPASTSFGTFEAAEQFMAGNTAFSIMWTSFGSLYEGSDTSKVKGKVGYTWLPAGMNPKGPHAAANDWWYYAVASTSKNKEWAYRFVRYISEPKWQMNLLETGGYPLRVSILRDKSLYAKYPFLETAEKIAAVGKRWPLIPEFSEVNDAIQEMASKAVAGVLSVKDALQQGQDKVTAIMKRAGYY